MSSHHIVKDEQEPALILENINKDQWAIVLQLLEWSPTVVASEGVLNKILSEGHKVDVALVSKETLETWEEELAAQKPITILPTIKEKFLPQAIELLKARNHRAINIVTSNIRLFEVISSLLEQNQLLDIVIFTEDQKHVLCKSMIFKKWLPAFSSLSVLPLKEKSFMKTTGFDLDLNNEPLMEGIVLTRKMEGEVTIKMTHTPFLISEDVF
jgi:thiamine pyrophosphokinase